MPQSINTSQYHYFYKVVNLKNNKYYYGVHSTTNLDDGYMVIWDLGLSLKELLKDMVNLF